VSLKKCIVSFKDNSGFRHAVEVEAESLYEAVALATKSFSEHGCAPGVLQDLEVAVRAPVVTHTVNLKRVKEWMATAGKSPKEAMQKYRVKELLSALSDS
jgi:hypothetical protein